MTNAEIAILSLIAERPCHGYEIEQLIQARGMREWTEIGFSSIYYLLKKLEKQGLISASLQPPEGPGPARKVFSILPEGEAALQEAALEALTNPRRIYPHIQVGLANLFRLPREKVQAALQTYAHILEQRMRHIRSCQHEQQPLPWQVDAMFAYSEAMIEAETMWVKQFLVRLEEENVED